MPGAEHDSGTVREPISLETLPPCGTPGHAQVCAVCAGGGVAGSPVARRSRGWRDRGWTRIDPRPVPRATEPVTLLVPLSGIARREDAQRAQERVDALRLDATARVSPGGVTLRFWPGACPIGQIAETLAPLGVTADVAGARRVSPAPVELTLSTELERVRARDLVRDRGRVARTVGFLRAQPDVAFALAGGVVLVVGWLVGWFAPLGATANEGARWSLLAAAAFLTSRKTFPEALASVRSFKVNIDVLMFAAAIGAASIGHPEEGVFLLFLFGLGAAGEHAALGHAERAVHALGELAPDTAQLVRADGAVETVAVEDVVVGSEILVRPYDRLPLDGEVIEGVSAVDESTVTGEPIPVEKRTGDAVFAGTLNAGGLLCVRVTKPAGESTVAKIMQMVAEARGAKSAAQSFTERIEAWYVPLVFVLTAGVFLVQPLVFEVSWGVAFYRSMAFMTAASPCALAIGTPATVLCGVARGARLGVLFKGGAHLESLGRVRAIALDKTGTLTAGKPSVHEVYAEPGFEDALRLAGAVEARVTHPLAEAIAEEARARFGSLPEASEVAQTPGRGASGVVEGVRVEIARAGAGEDASAWPVGVREAVERAEREGRTTAVVHVGGEPVAVIALGDEVRPSAAEAVARLRDGGVRTLVMLTGDREGPARRVGEAVGVDSVRAELHPGDKVREVEALLREHGSVAMIGDGVNDAPALARATVGVAMGAAGADAAVETADVALMGNDLRRLADAHTLSRRSNAVVRQNLAIALVVIALIAPLGAVGIAPLGVAVLLHEGSTIVVVLNALRLLRGR
ncbi:MAG: cadmium-translocating P-type ATPase [Phycisphaerales bacterium]|nr:MAG: cadmium-translocating P-type ATPase [Phycisphaerales bacterium]